MEADEGRAAPPGRRKALAVGTSLLARPTLLVSAGRYYDTSVLSLAQAERSMVTLGGKVLKTPKDLLRTQPGLKRG